MGRPHGVEPADGPSIVFRRRWMLLLLAGCAEASEPTGPALLEVAPERRPPIQKERSPKPPDWEGAACDDVDPDCNGGVRTWFADADRDGFGDPAAQIEACEPPVGFVDNDLDCDDDPASCGVLCSPLLVESCTDGFDNDCDGMTDAHASECAPSPEPNAPPRARFVVRPGAAPVGSAFEVDASLTADAEDSAASLTFRWDLDGDGAFDVEIAGDPTATFTFNAGGVRAVTLEVVDSGGRAGRTIGHLVVTSAAEDPLVVTSAADTVDPTDGALTLREAMLLANERPGPDTITFPGPAVVTLESRLPTITDADTRIIGSPDVVLIGSAAALDYCLGSTAPRTTIMWLTMHSCPNDAFELNSSEQWIAHVTAYDNGDDGVDLKGENNRVGPGVYAFGNQDTGLEIEGASVVMRQSRAFANGTGIRLSGGVPASYGLILENEIVQNGVGIAVEPENSDIAIWHNTIHGSETSAIEFLPSQTAGVVAGSHDVRNNVIASSGGWGIRTAATFSALSNNLWFSNALGRCNGCASSPTGPTADPQLLDPPHDLRVWATSPCVDAAEDLGVERSGIRAGAFEGSGPDIGAHEQF